MFTQSGIYELVASLNEKNCSLYHACQLMDLRSYCQIGGIPSRQLLAQSNLPFTPFDTDQIDRVNQVWDKAFLNLDDFGKGFALGWQSVPNPYGPILLQFKPEILLSASDVAICLRSAGAQGFDRDRESLSTTNDVERLFTEEGWLKFGDALREEFDDENAQSVEISCSTPLGFLPFGDNLRYVKVDPYSIDPYTLKSIVEEIITNTQGINASDAHIIDRTAKRNTGRRELYGVLFNAIGEHGLEYANWSQYANENNRLHEWFTGLQERGLLYQLNRYVRYLQAGTLNSMQEWIMDAEADDEPDFYSYDEMAQDWGFDSWEDFDQSRE